MLRFKARFGLMTMALGGFVAACGSSNDIASGDGTGGAFPGGFTSMGGLLQNGSGGVVNLGGGAGTASGGAFQAGGAAGSGGTLVGAGGAGTGGTATGGAPPATGGAATDGGTVADGGALDGSKSGAGGTSGTGGTSDVDAGKPYCGNHVVDGTDQCDVGAVDTAACDADCTLPVCSDKHVNGPAGEFCDDGNKANGDGCDSSCQMENTCPAPQSIALADSPAAPGTLHGLASGDSTDATSHVNPAACDGATRGAGPDALYSFSLDRTRNVTVSLVASFDGILRTYTKACVPGAGLSEAGGDACSNGGTGTESMSFSRLPAGTYYVIVDGADTAEKGTYTVDIAATCDGIDDLRIVELGIGTPDYAVIRNMSDCPASLAGTKLKFDDSTQPDVVTSLPPVTLAPGEQLRIQENLGTTPVPGAIDAGGSIPFEYTRGGTVLLCKTDCAAAADVVDVVQFADAETSTLEPPPAPPAGITFAFPLTGVNGPNQNTKSWVRVGNTGKNPTFTGADFCTGAPGAPFGLRLDEVFIGDPDFIAMKNYADCAVGLSQFQVRLETGGVTPVINAPLDSRSLASGATVYLSEPPNRANDVNTGTAIPNVGGASGTVRLCRGTCATPGTTVDVIAWNGVLAAGGTPTAFPALPIPLSFSPGGLEGITDANQQTASYRRAAIKGNNSLFFASDWSLGTKSR
jgi:cysteine-rich repeat protein